MSTFIEFHTIQTLPPSNINRNDTGAPKTAEQGGVRRLMVSSQSWKAAIRSHLRTNMPDLPVTQRTLRGPSWVSEELASHHPDLSDRQRMNLAVLLLESAGLGTKGPNERQEEGDEGLVLNEPTLGAVTPLPPAAVAAIVARGAELLESADFGTYLDTEDVHTKPRKGDSPLAAASKLVPKGLKKELKELVQAEKAVDTALFGRMVASTPDLGVEASCAFSPALGVTAVQPEFDYYTAQEERAREDHRGAAMMGASQFASGTVYRYAVINLDSLVECLGADLAKKAILGFAEANMKAKPSGKRNSWAHDQMPAAVQVVMRDDQPMSLANAFDLPIEPSDRQVAEEALERMLDLQGRYETTFGSEPLFTSMVATVGAPASSVAEMMRDLDTAVDSAIGGTAA